MLLPLYLEVIYTVIIARGRSLVTFGRSPLGTRNLVFFVGPFYKISIVPQFLRSMIFFLKEGRERGRKGKRR